MHINFKTLFVALCLLACIAPQSAAITTRRAQANLIRRAEAVTGDRFRFETETDAGVQVYSVSKPAPAMLRAIDEGFRDLAAVASRNGYRARLRASDYTVFIARADRTKDSRGIYSPDLQIGAANYGGSVYDRGGYIFVAGMVLAFEPGAFVIPEHTREWTRVRDVVRYEGEHIVLYHNDRKRYDATADHSRGGGHPILR